MKKENFITELKALCEKYGLCVVPEENGKYELPLIIAPYEGENKSLYDYLEDSDLYDYLEDSDLEDDLHYNIDDDISDEELKFCKEHGIRVTAVDMVWDDKKKEMVEVRNERLV
jgi:hypothetical protein